MLKVNTVCINGMGSSLILKITTEKAFKELGIEADVKCVDAGQFKGCHPDVCITTPSLAKTIGEREGMILIKTTNFTDVNALKEKIKVALNLDK
ncbi:MAG: PTS sugar transporter subunit IIB [Clostridium sp.]|uniref:PTS sugar transporter subunit IIB n=1 Tax=Clostridium sp. TaxID=1506 RepID=UPI0025C53C9F|nr:PTS sugar transporter subunit IIB [Clostridium sp.]MCI6693785.1 PTS sugar transporter subunit IIB [Clostridium sp.]MDY2631384.1 PTS sugar transporter subunit IIB [Clostridium sp.]MDY4253572.1 PTS sugar transporter subunit IIB [Clostridium sp.]